MRDMSSAHVALAGSGLGILPANSGGIATQPRAPGHERTPHHLRCGRRVMTVRVPPSRHRVPTYPSPPRLGPRVTTV